AGFLVLDEGVERLALVGPLSGPVVARDDGVVVARGVTGFGLQDRPVRYACAVAGRLAVGILVKRIERHALCVCERWPLRGGGGLGRRRRARTRDDGKRNRGGEQCRDGGSGHLDSHDGNSLHGW